MRRSNLNNANNTLCTNNIREDTSTSVSSRNNAKIHCVSKKLHPFYFSNNFVDSGPIRIIFGNDTPEENCNKTCIVFQTTPIFAPLLYLAVPSCTATNLTDIHSDKHQNQMVKSGKSQDADKTFKNKSRQSEQVLKVSSSVSFHIFTQISNF